MHALATVIRALLCGACAALAAAPTAQALDWSVDVTPAGELFPALQLSQPARTGDGGGDGLVGVHVRGDGALPPRLRLRIDTPGLRAPAIIEATPAAGVTQLDLHPRLDWDVEALHALAAPRRQTLVATLEADGVAETRRTDVRLHALDDAPYYVREGAERVDLGWVFAAYVDPRDPVVDEVLASARAIDPGFDAAGRGAAADRRRVAAVWAALERHGVRYAAGDPALSRGPVVWSQRVRAPSASWRERRASCIDGSVLIASVLERIGVQALIALVPGHAFVGFRSDGPSPQSLFLETTLLGTRHGTTTAASSYAAALAAGHARWRRAAARLDGRHAPDYALLDIGRARAYGIIPLSAAHGVGGSARGE